MKRVISVILTLAMLLSLVAVVPVFTSSATEAEYEHTLGDYNVGVKAYKFDGTVYWTAFGGLGNRNTTPFYWAKDHFKEALPLQTVTTGTSDNVLTIDGVIEAGEWGTPSLTLSSKDAVVFENGKGTDFNYAYPNAENSFFTYINNADGLAVKDGKLDDENLSIVYEGLKYDLYFMWDNNYLYIGARVYDPDGHYNKTTAGADDANGNNNTLANTWDGDALQFRIDGEGPNSVTNGGNYDASQPTPPTANFPTTGLPEGSVVEAGQYAGDMDPMTGEKYTDSVYTYPWASSSKQFRQEVKTDVCNFTVAYSLASNGFTAIHDSAKRYNPHTVQHLDGNVVLMEYTAYDGCSLSVYNTQAYTKVPVWNAMSADKDRVYATVTPQFGGFIYDPTAGTAAGRGVAYKSEVTDYEIALPWSYVNLEDTTEIAPGLELGVAIGLLNAKSGTAGYNSTLEWGNGVFNARMSAMPQTCGGSNSLILSETSYKDHVACDHTFADPTCEQPYTCTKCGYQKGYKSGHKYNTFEELLPTSNESGYTKAQCIVCEDIVTRELASGYRNTHASFSREETTHENIYDNWSVGYSSLWIERIYEYDSEGKVVAKQTTNSQGEAVDAGTQIKTVEDNKIKMSFWAAGAKKPYCSMTKDDTDLITNPFGFAVLDCTSVDQTGTYFLQSTGSPSYTYKMDINMVGVYDADWPEGKETITNVNYGSSGYLDQFFFWFGGANEMDYQAGLYKIKGEWYFAIIKNSAKTDRAYINKDQLDSEGTPSGKDGLEEFRRQAIVMNKVSEDVIKFGDWHEMVFFYDKNACVASLYWDDTLVAGAYDETFASAKNGNEGNSMFRPFNIQFYMTDLEIGTSTLASKYVSGTGSTTPEEPAAKYAVTVNGAVIGEYEAGETVTVTADVAEGYSFDGWTGNVAFADATATTTTFTMPAEAVAVEYTTTKIVVKYAVTVNGTVIGEYEEGETVTVTADVADGYSFDGWTGSVAFADAAATTTTFVMPAEEVAVSYTTTKIPVFYTVYVNGAAVGTYEEGDTVTVTATVADGYTFDGWTSATGVAFADATAATTTFAMPAGDVYVEYTTTKAPVKGDVNGDGSLNIADIFALKDALLNRGEYDASFDVNEDGKINLIDMFTIKSLLL